MSVVSVIMAAYNVRPYVAAAIGSVLRQSLCDLELIVIDDGSTDGTDAALAKVRDPRMRVIRTENRGVCHARNRALLEVGSPYVAIMDSDDVSDPSRLARQVAHLERCPQLAAVGCWVWLMTPRGRKVYEDRCPTGEQNVLRELYESGGGVYPQTCVLRTELARKVGGYRPLIPVAEDTDLLLRMSAYGGVDNVPAALYSYRLNPRGLTFSSKARRDYYGRLVLRLWAERQETGRDSIDRGVPVEPFISTADGYGYGEHPYTVAGVLASFYRQGAIERIGRGQFLGAIGGLCMSLAYAPSSRRTWRTLAKVLLRKQRAAV